MREPLVVKVGGALSHVPGALDDVAEALAALARERRVVVVPGGGPFADAVRKAQAEHGATEDAAHWMAVLGMEQYAHLLADHVPGAVLVESLEGAARVEGRVAVFAPYRWMREADPLPHSWEATSDSIAAVVAGRLGATELLLVKATTGTPELLADAFFARACPPGLVARCVTTRGIRTMARMPADRAAPPAGAPPAAPR